MARRQKNLGKLLEFMIMIDETHEPIISDLEEDPDLRELAEYFAERMPALLDGINTAMEKLDMGQLRKRVQAFKGIAVSGGFLPLAEKAIRIEQLVSHDNIEKLHLVVDELNQLCHRVSTSNKP